MKFKAGDIVITREIVCVGNVVLPAATMMILEAKVLKTVWTTATGIEMYKVLNLSGWVSYQTLEVGDRFNVEDIDSRYELMRGKR